MADENQTTPPIDIMEIAATHLHNARAALNGTMYLQASPAATLASEIALTMFHQAQADMDAAQRVAREVLECENVIIDF